MKDSLSYRLSLKLVPIVFLWGSVLLYSTCRIKVHGQNYRDEVDAHDGPGIGSFWHYSILFSIFFMRKAGGVAMISASKDGEFISQIAKKIGFDTVRGSRSRGGIQALKGLIRHMRKGKNAAIVADGSQGPPKKVQAGCIVLASRTGAPILPFLWSCNRYKRFGSWDGTVLPMPFSKIDFFYGEPLYVPAKIKSDEIEEFRIVLENRLNDLYAKAWSIQGKTVH